MPKILLSHGKTPRYKGSDEKVELILFGKGIISILLKMDMVILMHTIL